MAILQSCDKELSAILLHWKKDVLLGETGKYLLILEKLKGWLPLYVFVCNMSWTPCFLGVALTGNLTIHSSFYPLLTRGEFPTRVKGCIFPIECPSSVCGQYNLLGIAVTATENKLEWLLWIQKNIFMWRCLHYKETSCGSVSKYPFFNNWADVFGEWFLVFNLSPQVRVRANSSVLHSSCCLSLSKELWSLGGRA